MTILSRPYVEQDVSDPLEPVRERRLGVDPALYERLRPHFRDGGVGVGHGVEGTGGERLRVAVRRCRKRQAVFRGHGKSHLN